MKPTVLKNQILLSEYKNISNSSKADAALFQIQWSFV